MNVCGAETIYLKNGRTIVADSAQENNNRVVYTIGENTFAIPKSSVERIDTGGTPVVTQRESVSLEPPNEAPLTADAELMGHVVRNGKVDVEALGRIEQAGLSMQSAAANYFAAQHERANGSLEAATRYMQRAWNFLPDNAGLAGNYASLLAEMGRFSEAVAAAQHAINIGPNAAFGYTVLGYAEYHLGKMKEAQRSLKKSLELQPDEQTRSVLAKVERDLNAEGNFTEQSSSHFTLHYEGGQAPVTFRRQILDVLESHFTDLTQDLDYLPRESIQVVLYTNQQFFDVTQAPKWTGAINDGKLRIPISGLSSVDSQLSRVLKHELTHSFINLMSRGRAPNWLHEGVAQMEEPRNSASNGRRLSILYNGGHNIPLNELEGPFLHFSAEEAHVAYAQSLVSVEYIRDTYGMSSVTDVLKRIGQGQSAEAALRASIHSGYSQFEREITDWLRRTYGN